MDEHKDEGLELTEEPELSNGASFFRPAESFLPLAAEETESTKEPEETAAEEVHEETEDAAIVPILPTAPAETEPEVIEELQTESAEAWEQPLTDAEPEPPEEKIEEPVIAEPETEDLMDVPTREYFAEDAPVPPEIPELELPSANRRDPLENVRELPDLFSQQRPIPEEQALPEQQTAIEPTIVKRKRKEKHIAFRILKGAWCVLRSVLKWAFALLLVVAILAAGLVGYLTVTEYNPDYAEKAEYGSKQITTPYQVSMPLRIATFNTGYGALGEEADFFMDGGESVTPESEDYIKMNMIGIENTLRMIDADIILMQEVDTDSKRSYGINQWLQYEFDLKDYESRFALNYSCDYVPYPIGTDFIGKVHSGVATYSRFNISSATRYSLPCPFSWPTRVANLKRCLLVTRIPIEGLGESDDENFVAPELVIINVHLDAYDDGDGREAQFKQLLDLMEVESGKGNYVIVGGDFNQTFPGCDTYPVIHDEHFKPGVLPELPRRWQYVYDDSNPTSRLLNAPYDPTSELTQYYMIDGFIVSPNVTVKKVYTYDGDFKYSDHNPVVMDIELK